MDYGTLIRQAWTITWRYRFLWLLGIWPVARWECHR